MSVAWPGPAAEGTSAGTRAANKHDGSWKISHSPC